MTATEHSSIFRANTISLLDIGALVTGQHKKLLDARHFTLQPQW